MVPVRPPSSSGINVSILPFPTCRILDMYIYAKNNHQLADTVLTRALVCLVYCGVSGSSCNGRQVEMPLLQIRSISTYITF